VLLDIRELSKSFAGVRAVDNVSFTVARGSITGLIGPNGSGKTTAIDCIAGFQRSDRGRILLDGVDITGLPPHKVARAGLMRTFQTVQLYEDLSLLDNLLIAAQQLDPAGFLDEVLRTRRYRDAAASAEARAVELAHRIGLAERLDAPAGIFSYGQKKLIALAAALMPKPRIVVLDEPVAGVNPTRIREIETILRRFNEAGETFLMVAHNVEFITSLSHRIIVLDQGRILVAR